MNAFERVIAHPSSLQARRELAAAWTHHGHAQARLLSLAMAEQDGLPRFEAKAARREIRELIDAHGREWAGRIGELASWYKYELGLISSLTVSGDTLARHGDELFALAPILSLGISQPLRLAEVLKMPQMKQVKSLVLEGESLTEAEAVLLAGCANLQGLVEGAINCHSLSRAGVQTLLDSPYFDNMVACAISLSPEVAANFPDGRQRLMCLDGRWYMQNDAAAAPYWNAAVAAAHQTWNMYVEWPPLLDDLYWTA